MHIYTPRCPKCIVPMGKVRGELLFHCDECGRLLAGAIQRPQCRGYMSTARVGGGKTRGVSVTRYWLVWHSRVMARTTTGKTLYATRAQAQADCDFCQERYADIGTSYSVETVDEAAEALETETDTENRQQRVDLAEGADELHGS